MKSQVIASWKLALTCNSVWPWLACTCNGLSWLAFTLIELKFAHKWMCTGFPLFGHHANWFQYCFPLNGLACKAALKWLSCYLHWTFVYLWFRLATHHKFVFASSYFLTCIDLQFRLAGLKTVSHIPGGKWHWNCRLKEMKISGYTWKKIISSLAFLTSLCQVERQILYM